MAKATPKRTAVQKAPRAEVNQESGVQPLFAVNAIIYGAGQKALQEIFTPASEKERGELLDLQAARELNPAEAALYEKLSGAKVAAADADPEPEETPPADGDFG